MTLPHCDELFEKFCRPFYDPDNIVRRRYPATRPDLETSWEPNTPVEALHVVSSESQQQIALQLGRILASARGDWKTYLAIDHEPSLDWVERFDGYYDRAAIQRLIARSDPTDFGNDYLIVSIQFSAVLGTVLRKELPRLEWLYDWPYWEWALFDSVTGTRVNVFHWAVKKLSEYGVGDNYREKVLACVGLLERELDEES